jgi:hypothetical protein
MKIGFYLASFFTALILAGALLIVLEPHYDRQHNTFAICFSILVLTIHVAVLISCLFIKADLLHKAVIGMGWASMASLLLLSFTCQPNKQVPAIFTTISSQLLFESKQSAK